MGKMQYVFDDSSDWYKIWVAKGTEKRRAYPNHDTVGEGQKTIHGDKFLSLKFKQVRQQYHLIWDPHCTRAVSQMVTLPFLGIYSRSLRSHAKIDPRRRMKIWPAS
ncbi:MAG: hypothetical protein AB2693_19900 [Candidatus Thiodiazotropha sp.]